jgi:hypothetical protein
LCPIFRREGKEIKRFLKNIGKEDMIGDPVELSFLLYYKVFSMEEGI